ncbi:hypothetical protein DOY81_007499, partial [Sarcophaga bullata]
MVIVRSRANESVDELPIEREAKTVNLVKYSLLLGDSLCGRLQDELWSCFSSPK